MKTLPALLFTTTIFLHPLFAFADLIAPTTGSSTLSVTITGATDAIKLGSASYTGVDQSSPLDALGYARGGSGNPSASVTTVTANDVVTATLSRFSTTDATTNRTSIYNDSITSTLGAASYQLATTAGSYSDTYTGSASADWSMAMAAFKPATGGTGTTTVAYIHTDHLSGSNAITNDHKELVQVLDYYPFGSLRVNETYGNFDEKKKFTGYEYDSSTGLNYAGARYQQPLEGRFISQDPASRDNPGQFVADPQQLNSYSYARDNPIVNVDRNGKEILTLTSPLWVPVVIGTVAIISTYFATLPDVRQAFPTPRWSGTRQVPNVGIPDPPSVGDLGPPNWNPSAPKWLPWVITGAGIIEKMVDFWQQTEENKNLYQGPGNKNNYQPSPPTWQQGPSGNSPSSSSPSSSNNVYSSGSAGSPSSQQLSSLQSQINQIRSQVNQLQIQISALKK